MVVDTVIKSGEAEVDESFITGESETIYKKLGIWYYQVVLLLVEMLLDR